MQLEFDEPRATDALHGAWQCTGVIKVRAFLSSEDVSQLSAFVDSCYRTIERALSTRLDLDLSQNFQTWNGVAARPLAAFLAQHQPQLVPDWLAIRTIVTNRLQGLIGSR